MLDTCIADVEVFQFVVIQQVEDIETGSIVVVHRVVFLVVGFLPARVLGSSVDEPQVFLVVGIRGGGFILINPTSYTSTLVLG